MQGPLDSHRDLLKEVPDRAAWDAEPEVSLEGFGGLAVGGAGGELGGRQAHLRGVTPLPEAERHEEGREGPPAEAIPYASDPEVDPTHPGDQGPGAGAMAHEAPSTIGELRSPELLPEDLLSLLEDGLKGVPPLVVGAVQQLGKLYRRYGVLVRGPLLLLGS